MAYNLKNYTSTVPVSSTVAALESALAKAGASGIMKKYDNGSLVAVLFQIPRPGGAAITVRLPSNTEAVLKLLKASVRRVRPGTLSRLSEQAQRTAWRLMLDWVLVQISLIRLAQADVMEVFLPYIWDGQQTVFQRLKEDGYKALCVKNETHATETGL